MRKLFEFLYRYRAFLFFVFLEVVCGWLIVRNNTYQGVAMLNSSNVVVGSLMSTTHQVTEYVHLRETNQNLAMENARLNSIIRNNLLALERIDLDTASMRVQGLIADTLPAIPQKGNIVTTAAQSRNFRLEQLTSKFNFKVAKVINNSVNRFDNYITIDKGLKDGVRPGMGVMSPQGVVGRVRYCSDNFSTVTSVLHNDMTVSSQIKSSKAVGSVRWEGSDPKIASMHYIPRYHNPQVGDTIVTSGYNTIFPENVMVGVISKVSIGENSTFHTISLDLSTDFSTLTYVYLIDNTLQHEQDSLQAKTSPNINDR
jgi:rod shape-determining protein MreC